MTTLCGAIGRDMVKVHQLHNFLDITCNKIGGFNVYHQQKTTYTIVQASRVLHFKCLCEKKYMASILVMRLTGYLLLPPISL